MTNHIQALKELLSQRSLRHRTISIYVAAVESLLIFYANVRPEDLTFEQISDYVNFLSQRKKVAATTISQNLASFNLFFNALLNKNFDFQVLKPKRAPSIPPEILSPDEVHRLLNLSISDTKNRLVLSLIYSAGLEISQATQLKIDDVDFINKEIKIRNLEGKIIRVAVLAENLIVPLRHYLDQYKPEKWFFEGKKKGTMYSASIAQKVFNKSLKIANITKKVTVRNLKYSYVKHVEMYGVPLQTILQNMGINNTGSLYFYSQMGITNKPLSFSPFDRITHESDSTEIEIKPLEDSFLHIQNGDEKSYLLEALKCLKARAPRAAVIFSWNAAIRNIQSRCLLFDNSILNTALRKHFPKASVSSITDFEDIKDRYVLEATETLGLFDKHEKNVLLGCLDLRNHCGHPGDYVPGDMRVAAFLEDLYKIVFSKPYSAHEQRTQIAEYGRIRSYPEDDGLPF
jgi:site-specific recombinase XerD